MCRSRVSHGATVPSALTSMLARVPAMPDSGQSGCIARTRSLDEGRRCPDEPRRSERDRAGLPVRELGREVDRAAIDADRSRHRVAAACRCFDDDVATPGLPGDDRPLEPEARRSGQGRRRRPPAPSSRHPACPSGRGRGGRRDAAGPPRRARRPPHPTSARSRRARGRARTGAQQRLLPARSAACAARPPPRQGSGVRRLASGQACQDDGRNDADAAPRPARTPGRRPGRSRPGRRRVQRRRRLGVPRPSCPRGARQAGAHAVTAVSPSLAGDEEADCRALAAEWGLRWTPVTTDEMATRRTGTTTSTAATTARPS